MHSIEYFLCIYLVYEVIQMVVLQENQKIKNHH